MLLAQEAVALTEQNRLKSLPLTDQLVKTCLNYIEEDILNETKKGCCSTRFSFPSIWLGRDVNIYNSSQAKELMQTLRPALECELEKYGYKHVSLNADDLTEWQIKVMWPDLVDNGISELPMAHERYGI